MVPHWNPEQEKAYRLGFAEAVADLMYDCGATPQQVSKFKYWDRITLWAARGGKKTSMGFQVPPRMTKDECKQFVAYLNAAFWDKQGDVNNA